MENLISLWTTSGLAQIELGQVAMMAVCLLLAVIVLGDQ